MNGFVKGMLMGVAAGVAADMALRTSQGKKTPAGRAMETVTEAVDSAAMAVKENLGK